MEWNNQTQMWVAGGVAVIILAFAGWWFFTGGQNQNGDTTPDTGTATTTDQTGTTTGKTDDRPSVDLNTGESVMVDDQPAGDSVRVVEARLSRVSWIAVRDDMRIYGAARVHPPEGGGIVSDVTVPLLRNTEAGATYKVVVYADDGDNAFDFEKDALVTGLEDTFNALNGD